MVKKFLSVFAVSSMIFATSCSNEDFVSPATEGESLVNFAVQLPDGLNSRAYGDGTTATNLNYSVYEVNSESGEWNYIADLDGTATFSGLTTTVNLRLVNGRDYKVVFWASAPSSPYTYNASAKTVTANYTDCSSNDENLDAFYAVEGISVSASASHDVVLKRPFAQLNIGTADLDAYATAGLSVSEAGISVTNVYTTFSFENENVAGEAQSITFSNGNRPNDQAFPVAGYDYLTMNYLLVSKDKQTVDVTLNYGGAVNPTYANVPVQRNYRTNIYGNLLTSQEDFNITINPDFDGTYDQSVWDGTVAATLSKDTDGIYHITSANQLALLMKQTNAGNNSLYSGETFKLDTDISFANQTITGMGSVSDNIVFTFDGNGHTISDFKIESTDEFYAGLFQQFTGTVKNLTVKNATVKGNNMVGIIASNVDDNGVIDNCTVENCKVYAVKKAGAITGYTSNGTVKNCVAKDVEIYCQDAHENQSGEIVGYINAGSTINNNTATHVSVIRDYLNIEVVTVSSAAELLSLGTTPINNTTIDIYNKYIILTNDIDCSGVALKPLRLIGNSTFDGAGYKMTNVTTGLYDGSMSSIFSGALAGFGNPKNVTIKNLVIDNVVAASTSVDYSYAAVLYADVQDGMNITIDNVNIYNAVVKDAQTVGGFVGFLGASGENTLTIKNSSVNNSTITGIEEVGKIGAFVGRAQLPYTCDAVIANNVTCYYNDNEIVTTPEGTKSASKCTTGYTIR